MRTFYSSLRQPPPPQQDRIRSAPGSTRLKLPLPDAHGVVDGVGDLIDKKRPATHAAKCKTLAATGSQTTININTKDAALDCAFSVGLQTQCWKLAATALAAGSRE